MKITLYTLAHRFRGMKEIAGEKDQPFIVWCHSLCGLGIDQPDETPWCSSWLNGLAFLLGLPRSESAAARSWLEVGKPVFADEARPEFDVVVFKRGPDPQPGPEVTRGAPGHVGLFAGEDTNGEILVLGGNQGNTVSIQRFPANRLLGIRRLYD